MRVTVDQDRCISTGQCVMTVPEVFDQRTEDGVVTLLQTEPGPELHEDVREAAEHCPVHAITVVED